MGPPRAVDPEESLARIISYAEKTKIKFQSMNRYSHWRKAGLPDLRGFTPHLRAVNLYADRGNATSKVLSRYLERYSSEYRARNLKKNFGENLEEEHLWIIHDILHIVYYDYATLHLGRKSWLDDSRFIENHLASEAFAVLLLDYFLLPDLRREGLATDFDPQDWNRFQLVNPDLPHFQSSEFCEKIVKLYLTDEKEFLNLPTKTRGKNLKNRYLEWAGHEIRYATKQRHYVMAWLSDLKNLKSKNQEALVEETFAFEPVWQLISLFTKSDEQTWRDHVHAIKKSARAPSVFSPRPKYRSQQKNNDFRFTDITALTPNKVRQELKASTKPSSSSLFLFWQVLSSFIPTLLTEEDREWIRKLEVSAQTLAVNAEAWKKVRSVCLKLAPEMKWKVASQRLSTFFLP